MQNRELIDAARHRPTERVGPIPLKRPFPGGDVTKSEPADRATGGIIDSFAEGSFFFIFEA